MTKSLMDAAKDNALLQRVLAQQGVDGVYTTLTQFLAAAATAYVVGAVLRLSDATSSPVSAKPCWPGRCRAGAGCSPGWRPRSVGVGGADGRRRVSATVWARASPSVSRAAIVRLTTAGLAFVPAMAVMAGVAALGGGSASGRGIGWLAVTFVVIALYLGALLRLPRWLLDASPVGQTKAPSQYPVFALTGHAHRRRGSSSSRRIYRRRDAVVRIRRRNHEDHSSNVGVQIGSIGFFGLLLFWPAGTFDYWQAWVFIARVRRLPPMLPSNLSGREIPRCVPTAYAVRGPRRDPNGAEARQSSASA